jgi:type I restriction enzyme, S subunit
MISQENKTPALRFPGFAEPWTETHLGEVGRFSKGALISKEDTSPDGSLECIRYGELYTYYGEIIDQTVSRTNLNKDCLVLSEENDVIIPASGETNIDIARAACVLRKGIAIGGDLNIIKSNIDGVFLSYTLNSAKRYDIARLAQGVSVVHLYPAHLKALILQIPSTAEQQKIAAFLSVVDERIGQLARKKQLLLKYKKGVMQQIFSQKIRFKDNNSNDFQDWDERRFGGIFSFLPTNSFSREDLTYTGGEVKNIHYGDIHTKFRPILNVADENIPYIGCGISMENVPDANFLKTGDIIFADASEDYADVGKCIEIGKIDGEKLVAGLHTLLARPKPDALAKGFGTYLMKSWPIRWQIMREAQGTKVFGISTGRLARINLMLPSMPEQAKIGEFLSSLETKIELVGRQIEETKTFKKGLLQQMFV